MEFVQEYVDIEGALTKAAEWRDEGIRLAHYTWFEGAGIELPEGTLTYAAMIIAIAAAAAAVPFLWKSWMNSVIKTKMPTLFGGKLSKFVPSAITKAAEDAVDDAIKEEAKKEAAKPKARRMSRGKTPVVKKKSTPKKASPAMKKPASPAMKKTASPSKKKASSPARKPSMKKK